MNNKPEGEEFNSSVSSWDSGKEEIVRNKMTNTL